MVQKDCARIFSDAGIGSAAPTRTYRAGLWREQHPVWDAERCFQCGICYLICPDAAVVPGPDGSYAMDPDRCKGCGVCAAECLNDAISMQPGQ